MRLTQIKFDRHDTIAWLLCSDVYICIDNRASDAHACCQSSTRRGFNQCLCSKTNHSPITKAHAKSSSPMTTTKPYVVVGCNNSNDIPPTVNSSHKALPRLLPRIRIAQFPKMCRPTKTIGPAPFKFPRWVCINSLAIQTIIISSPCNIDRSTTIPHRNPESNHHENRPDFRRHHCCRFGCSTAGCSIQLRQGHRYPEAGE